MNYKSSRINWREEADIWQKDSVCGCRESGITIVSKPQTASSALSRVFDICLETGSHVTRHFYNSFTKITFNYHVYRYIFSKTVVNYPFFYYIITMLLDVQNLNAGLEDGKQILNDLNIQIGQGETHVLMGPNGAGKSSLGNALMGNPVYKITGGKILFKNTDKTEESADKRAKLGMFMSFQSPLEVPGISLEAFIR